MKGPQLLKRLRTQQNYSQLEVANALGVTNGSVSQYETGRVTPKRAHAQKLDEFLNASGDLAAAFGYLSRPDDDVRAQLDELRQEGRVTRAMIRDLTERSALLLAAVEARIVLVERNQRAGRGAS